MKKIAKFLFPIPVILLLSGCSWFSKDIEIRHIEKDPKELNDVLSPIPPEPLT